MKFSASMFTLAFLVIVGANLGLAEEKCGEKRDLYKRWNSLFDQDFGLAFSPGDFLTSIMSAFSSPFFSPTTTTGPGDTLASLSIRDVDSTIKTDKDQFQINLDVQDFSSEEITVKAADGYVVVIEGKHEAKVAINITQRIITS